VLTIGGALIGAGINYGSQVYNNFQSNCGDLGAALTQDINLASVGESALAGAAIGFSIGLAAPVVVGLAGDALIGVGLAFGSTTLFSAGMSAYEASAGLGAAIYGISKATKIPVIGSSGTEQPDDNLNPGEYLAGKHPQQVEPGIRTRSGVYVNDLGREEPWTAHYDEYGRFIGRTDYNAANKAAGIDATHYHIYEYSGQYPYGHYTQNHIPGEYK
jgi:hypothetical protein